MAKKKSRGNGEGTIYYNEKRERWVAQYTAGIQPNGKLLRKTVYGKTRREVKQKLDDLVSNGTLDPNDITLAEMIARNNKTKQELNLVRSSTAARDESTLKAIQKYAIADRPIMSISDDEIYLFLKEITGYSNSIISKIYIALKNAFTQAAREKIITMNPLFDNPRLRKPKSTLKNEKVMAFTIAEQRAFLTAITKKTTKYNTQFLLALYTGMRMGEINALTKNDVDLSAGIIHIHRTITRVENYKTVLGDMTKTHAGMRDITITPFVVQLLQHYLTYNYKPNSHGLLFYDDKKHSFITTSQVNCQFQRIRKKYNIAIGKKITQHSLRHTYATRCIESGMPANVLQKKLGHTDIKTTLNTYCDVFEQFEKQSDDSAYEYLLTHGLLALNDCNSDCNAANF